MAEAIEVQALEKISTEVDESQVKVILSTQCIKAQTFLVDKLRKQSERHREVCSFISSANLKLDAEIKQAEQEIRSLTISQETIRLANVELRKDWLLAKENRIEIEERVSEGETKYEEMWLEAKTRYEKIPFVQQFLQANVKSEAMEKDITRLTNEADALNEDIEKKRVDCLDVDRKRVTELAEFFVNELPKAVKCMNEKTKAIEGLEKELETFNLEQAVTTKSISTDAIIVEQNLSKEASHPLVNEDKADYSNDEDFLLLPKLKLASYDLDNIDEKLHQIKRIDVFKAPLPRHDVPRETTCNRLDYTKETGNFFYVSSYFNDTKANEEDRFQNYSRRKLINILEDIKIDKNHAFSIVSKVNPEKMQSINTISGGVERSEPSGHNINHNNPIESEDIEEIDLTARSSENILIPPTQFLDQSAELIIQMTTCENAMQSSQESANKKRVTFDLASAHKTEEQTVKIPESNKPGENSGNTTLNSQFDESAISDDLANIKEIVLQKHHLELSPEFVYSKNTLLPKKNDDNVVISKFFKTNPHKVTETEANEEMDVDKHDDFQAQNAVEAPQISETDKDVHEEKDIHMDVDENNAEIQKREKPVAGFLFAHGTQAIPDSLNVSMSTTGYEDGDADFPHGIDSSLLLSPKADLPMPMSCGNAEVLSQEVPNFLSGLRKTGLSFFGCMPSSESKPDSSAQNQGSSFNFNFGGDERKNRGGLFSMFQ